MASSRFGRRWLIAATLLAVLLIAATIRLHGDRLTVLLADAPTTADRVDQLTRTAREEGADLVYLVIQDPADPRQGTVADLLAGPAELGKEPVVSLISADQQSEVAARLPESVRIINAAGESIRAGKASPGLLETTIWILLLLTTGAVLALSTAGGVRASGRRQSPAGLRDREVAEPVTPPTREWWSAKSAAAERVPAPVRPARTRLDLARFAGGVDVRDSAPQCPRCGAFDVQLNSAGADHRRHYECTHCGSTWSLRPDEPWPAVVVRPRYRSHPPGA